MTWSATESSCYKGSWGPHQSHADQCGRILSGAMWEAPGGGRKFPPTMFDPNALSQDMDLVMMGDVLGFNGGPAGFRHNTIMRRNITICSTRDFLAKNCTPGEERFVCTESFAYCASGDCAEKNKWNLSPGSDTFFARLSTTALNGTYDIVAKESSPSCPETLSAYQFGTQLGLGYAPHDMHMTRIVDTSMSTESADCVQFYSVCNGLQFHFDKAYAGRAYQEGSNLMLSLHVIAAEEGGDLLKVDKCKYKSQDKAPEMVHIVPDKTGAVIGLSITLTIFILGAAGLGCCCLSYRRRYIESKIDRAYDVFST